jgi:hypothetical protein
MNSIRLISSVVVAVAMSMGCASAQQRAKLGENAALRYWSAFAQMQDFAITDQQAKELNLILDGTAPYDDLKYKEFIEKNRLALETMARGTSILNCDWGTDYQVGVDAPVDYVRKSLAIGRLNVLYSFHLLINHDNDGAARTLAAGLRFSHDVANGGTLFAAISAKTLLVAHLRAVQFALQGDGLSVAQRSTLQKAIAQLGSDGLDWQSAVKRELEMPLGLDAKASAAVGQILPVFVSALNNPSVLPKLEEMRAAGPQPLPEIIPNPRRVIEERKDLIEKLQQTRLRLQ